MTYSFSMINFLEKMKFWDSHLFDELMSETGSDSIELVPSMVIGREFNMKTMLPELLAISRKYRVSSIQSLMYGLDISLASDISKNSEIIARIDTIKSLSSIFGCSVFVLGSPAQRKLTEARDINLNLENFRRNCIFLADSFSSHGTLSIEHNTPQQGAEFCNTLGGVYEMVSFMKSSGCLNVGINLDTKCLIQEFGSDVQIDEVVGAISESISSIQVSYDFLNRDDAIVSRNCQRIVDISLHNECPISLEEFGLKEGDIYKFAKRWREFTNHL